MPWHDLGLGAVLAERPIANEERDRFRCRACSKPYNEHSGRLLHHSHSPSDVIVLIML
jgi:hypothetical protein